MIRINLLTAERKTAKPARAAMFGAGQLMITGCSAILILSVLFVGWRYWSLDQQSKLLDRNISESQQETVRLRLLIQQVQQFEQQKTQLQQRVVLIEQLRKGQTGPVHMLDHISRALPPMLWLTELKQTEDAVVIDGRCTAVTNLTDFVTNLEASGFFKKSIDIVSSQSETVSAVGEMIKFSIRAQFVPVAELAKKP
jgi:type IV pilus assembly protein PilN